MKNYSKYIVEQEENRGLLKSLINQLIRRDKTSSDYDFFDFPQYIQERTLGTSDKFNEKLCS